MWSARSPEVTKIFSPLRTYSSPSRTAVVVMLAESEPVPGSVIAMPAQTPSNRASCSSSATRRDRGVAEPLPRHGEQQADVAPAHLLDRHHRGEVGAVLAPSRRRPRSPAHAGRAGSLRRAGLGQPVDHRREHVELLGVLVLGEVVLARDRSQHVHRDLVGLAHQRPEPLRVVEVDHQTSTAPSMTPTARRSRYHRSTGCSLTNPWPPSSWTPSRPIRMPWSAHSLAGERDLLAEVLARGGAAGGLVGQQPHRLQLDRDVGDHERHRLAVRDRLAERLALLDVRRHVVEHRLTGADREGAPGQPRRAARTRRTSSRRSRRARPPRTPRRPRA